MNCNHNEQSNSSYDKEVLQLFTFNQCEEVPIFEGEKNKMRYLIICPLCAKEPSYHKPSNGSLLIAAHVHLIAPLVNINGFYVDCAVMISNLVFQKSAIKDEA